MGRVVERSSQDYEGRGSESGAEVVRMRKRILWGGRAEDMIRLMNDGYDLDEQHSKQCIQMHLNGVYFDLLFTELQSPFASFVA